MRLTSINKQPYMRKSVSHTYHIQQESALSMYSSFHLEVWCLLNTLFNSMCTSGSFSMEWKKIKHYGCIFTNCSVILACSMHASLCCASILISKLELFIWLNTTSLLQETQFVPAHPWCSFRFMTFPLNEIGHDGMAKNTHNEIRDMPLSYWFSTFPFERKQTHSWNSLLEL